jgi:hypothetical protein
MNSTCLIHPTLHPTLHPTARRVYILTTGCPTGWMNYANSAVQPANRQRAVTNVTCVDINIRKRLLYGRQAMFGNY